jgi:aquaporin Z
MGKVLAAELLGTFWLVFGGCGSAVLAAAFPGLGIGLLGVSLAFGLTVLTMAYSIGHVSGCHLNPRFDRTVRRRPLQGGTRAALRRRAGGGRHPRSRCALRDRQRAAGILARRGAGLERLWCRAFTGPLLADGGLTSEVVLTMMFLFIILGSTDDRAPRGFAPLAIGLA